MSEDRGPGAIDRTLSKFMKSAAEQTEKDLKNKLYLALYHNLYNARVTEFIEDSYLWINDHSKPIEWRVDEMYNLVGRVTTLAGVRDDDLLGKYRSNYRKAVGRFWYAGALPYLRRRRQLGRVGDPLHLPLTRVVDMVTNFGERWMLPWGADVVDRTFGKSFSSPEFVLGMQTPPPMFGGASSEIDSELKALLAGKT